MDLETIFYTVGIIAGVLWIAVAIGAAFAVWKINKSLQTFKKTAVTSVMGFLAAKRAGLANTAGLMISSYFIEKARGLFSKKNKSKDE